MQVTFKQDGSKVSGIFKSQMGELPFQDGTLTGDDLKFGFSIPIQGQPLDVTMTGKVDGASIDRQGAVRRFRRRRLDGEAHGGQRVLSIRDRAHGRAASHAPQPTAAPRASAANGTRR